MKRLKRVGAILMALALIVGLLPAGVFHTHAHAAENSTGGSYNAGVLAKYENYFHASYNDGTITIDGEMGLSTSYTGSTEAPYRRQITLSNGKIFSIAWDKTNLYVVATADITELKIAGKTVTPTGDIKKEVAITLASLGISDLTAHYDFSITVDGVTWAGKLVFEAFVVQKMSTHKQVTYDKTAAGIAKDFWTYELDSYNSDGVYENEGFTTDPNNLSSTAPIRAYDDVYYPSALQDKTPLDFNHSFTAPTVVEMDIEVFNFNKLTSHPLTYAKWTSRSSLSSALNITILDDTKPASGTTAGNALVTAIYRYNDDLYLMFPDNITKSINRVKIGDYDSDGDGKGDGYYRLRMEYSYRQNAEGAIFVDVLYFVNGKLVAQADDVAKYSANWTSSGNNNIQILAYGGGNSGQVTVKDEAGKVIGYYIDEEKKTTSNENRTHVIIRNFTTGHEQSVLEIERLMTGVVNGNAAAVSAARKVYASLTAAQKLQLITAEQKLNFIHAAYATAKPDTIRQDAAVGGQKLGAAWSGNQLYLALSGATSVTINGKQVTATANEGVYTIPFADLGICDVDFDNGYPMVVKVDGVEYGFRLVFNTHTITNAQIATNQTDSKETNPDAYIDPVKGTNATYVEFYNAPNTTVANTTGVTSAVFKPSLSENLVMEMDVDLTNLAPAKNAGNVGVGNRYCCNGLNIVFMDSLCAKLSVPHTNGNYYTAQAFKSGFVARDGVLYFVYQAVDAEGTKTIFEVPLGPDAATEVHYRAEYIYADTNEDGTLTNADRVDAKYYINGVLVAEAQDVRETMKDSYTSAYGTSGVNQIRFSVEGGAGIIAKVSNLSVGKTQPSVIDAQHKAAADAVIAKIAAIGTVTLDSKAAIEAAEAAYAALSDAQKALVANYETLTDARAAYDTLKAAADKEVADKAAAAEVDALINALPAKTN